MSNKIKSPNEKSHGFIWALVIVAMVIAAVLAYIVTNGEKAESEKLTEGNVDKVNMSVKVHDGMITLSKDGGDAAGTPVADLYEDYSCPHCAELAEATDDDMRAAVEAGKMIVNIHPLNFLDRNEPDGHSTKAGAAALAVANSGNATDYWNYRAMLMRDQAKIYNKWSNEDFANAAQSFGMDSATVDAIRDGKDADEMREMAKKDAEKLNQLTGKVSSPRVLVDGKDVEDISNWVSEVTKAK
ncbi:DsbA family protein [Corynebacterium aquilae]|uniref:Thioredoxin-like fold domain-containing protein n=1 Tax=Corynebacterium aquilae DSM 44791 TaxID=1431546 RepID=A0A1L7CHQ5_9CORY|nr:thioredoxin domain-containing protein [Corynebacterium aquilae]APT85368.1 hypothetical protein CAQU_10220 [Corynebacterium aquilae DSM 44791]